MSRRPTLGTVGSAVAGVLLTLAAADPARASAESDITLRAAPAVAGIVKAERWTPLLVTIDSSRSSFDGAVLVTWGDARVRRDITFHSPGRRQFELHLRTSQPEAAIHVRLESDGQPLHSIDVPVRVLPLDEPATLCVMSAAGSTPGTGCTAIAAADLLPRSLRGYEAIERVVWPAGEIRLSPEQRAAFDSWQAFRRLELSGDLGLAPQPARPLLRRGIPADTAWTIGALAGSYGLCLATAGLLTTRRRMRLIPMWLSIAAVVTAGGGVAHTIFRLAPGSVQVHHGSVLHQIPGSDASVLMMKGIVEFPAFDSFTVQLPFSDGAIEPASSAGDTEQVIDETGLPALRGEYGLGSRQAFVAEGLVDVRPLAVTTTREAMTVVNRSAATLRDCTFADGFSVMAVGPLPPGASSTAQRTAEALGPTFTCVADMPFGEIRAPGHHVEMHGATLIAVYDRHPDVAPSGADD